MKQSRFVFTLSVILFCVSLVSSEMKLGLEDYNMRVDPPPTTRHSVREGPIEHGSPLNPYIPKPRPTPSPPPQSQDGP
ncbi:unnamed protein product [Eruca vesicaria subsp. sativa]|uniref:Transmembrane protein n=1 Tax=Eruca vesicaria subsp. sativa TaxID=29727 RepID=A0ABC8L9W2_ERUVS|nr:unnamed protein product [Eruca vesicaria subsp. sativa]